MDDKLIFLCWYETYVDEMYKEGEESETYITRISCIMCL